MKHRARKDFCDRPMMMMMMMRKPNLPPMPAMMHQGWMNFRPRKRYLPFRNDPCVEDQANGC